MFVSSMGMYRVTRLGIKKAQSCPHPAELKVTTVGDPLLPI
jgi:hypothetical protein